MAHPASTRRGRARLGLALSLILGVAAAPAGLHASDPQIHLPAAPPGSVLLFVASWCAACHTEIKAFEAITQAAAPRPVYIVPLAGDEGAAALLAAVPERQILRIAPAASKDMLHRLSRGTGRIAIPMAVVVDGAGDACVTHQSQVSARELRALIARCRT